MINITNCLLTGYRLDELATITSDTEDIFTYYHESVGKVKIAITTATEFVDNFKYHHPILAGICRNAYLNAEEPPIINQEFIDTGIDNLSFPKELREKARHLLKCMYRAGGKDFVETIFKSSSDYPLCYAEDPKEFDRIVNFLETKKHWIENKKTVSLASGGTYYAGVTLTELGIDEVEKELPNVPLVGLIQQRIFTGDATMDANIEHASKLFSTQPVSMENARSACQTLSFVLEPLRKDLSKYIVSKDVEDFFQIVNQFDVRHNKDQTKNIQHIEQLEWIYYSLLNIINTYVKLKSRIG